MDRRFTVKDFFVFVFLSAILVSLWLGKIQYDSLQSWMMKLDAQNQNAVSDMVRARDDIKNLSRMQDKLIETIANSGGGGVRIDPAQFVGADTVAPYFNGPAGALKFPDFAPGDEFVQSIPSRVKTLTPRVSSDAYAALAQAWVMDSLIDRDPDNPKVRHGVVAEENGWKIEMRKVPFRKGAEGGDLEWEVVDAGSDGAEVREVPVITFKMRKDVHFSDGVAMTAEDVVFSYEFTMNKKIAAARSRAYLNNIARVVALDMYTVEFTFVKPYFEALELAGGLSILAKHFYGKYLDDPEAFNQSKNLLFGSGPFMLKDMATWTTDKDIELIRNPRYWGDIKPWINQIRYTTITNDSAQIAAFRNGEVDIYGARPIEYRDLLADKDLMKGCNNYEYMRPTAGYSY
ncbi:MAG: ABC transporter substrate-binding protein, partial [Planctomycetota bacterium]